MDASGGDPAIELLPDAGREHDEHEHEPGGNIVQLGDDGGDPTDEDGVQEQGGAHLVNIIKCQIEAPVQDLLHSGLCPAAEGIQQDISMMLQDMNATQGIAEAEKAAIDSELERIQHLVRSFQERMNALMGLSLRL